MTTAARRRNGYTLIEIMVSIGLFGLILATSFLPFKMMRDATNSGGARTDLDTNVRNIMKRVIMNIQYATQVNFQPAPFPGNSTYSRIDFQLPDDATGATISYYSQQVPGGNTGELQLIEDRKVSGTSLAGYPKVLIASGITSFYFAPTVCTYSATPPAREYAYTLMFINVYPSDAKRPLPDPRKQPLTLATSIAIRNGANQSRPATSNPNLYP